MSGWFYLECSKQGAWGEGDCTSFLQGRDIPGIQEDVHQGLRRETQSLAPEFCSGSKGLGGLGVWMMNGIEEEGGMEMGYSAVTGVHEDRT